MSTTVTVRYNIDTDLQQSRPWAQPSAAPTVVLDNPPADYTVAVAAGATAVLWNPSLSGSPQLPLDFKFLFVRSDADVMLELTCNEGDVAERVFAVKLAADIPFILGSNVAYYNFTAGPAGDAFAGTLDVIDRLRVKNLASSGTALVNVVLGT